MLQYFSSDWLYSFIPSLRLWSFQLQKNRKELTKSKGGKYILPSFKNLRPVEFEHSLIHQSRVKKFIMFSFKKDKYVFGSPNELMVESTRFGNSCHSPKE